VFKPLVLERDVGLSPLLSDTRAMTGTSLDIKRKEEYP